MWSPHGLLRTFDNSWLLSCGAQVEIWSPFQPDMGDIQWTRGHKRSPRVWPFSQTSPRVRSPPNHLNRKSECPTLNHNVYRSSRPWMTPPWQQRYSPLHHDRPHPPTIQWCSHQESSPLCSRQKTSLHRSPKLSSMTPPSLWHYDISLFYRFQFNILRWTSRGTNRNRKTFLAH